MIEPIPMNFDWRPRIPVDGVAHLARIYQGAPYEQQFKVRVVDDDGTFVYRDFTV